MTKPITMSTEVYVRLTLRMYKINPSYARIQRGRAGYARIQRGRAGGSDPLGNHKALGLLSNTGPDALENNKTSEPVFNVWPISAR